MQGRPKGNISDSLSHALLARWRRNEGWPGGTDCDVAEGLQCVSGRAFRWQLPGLAGTYGVEEPGWAASGGGADTALAMKECSPDMVSCRGRRALVEALVLRSGLHAVESSIVAQSMYGGPGQAGASGPECRLGKGQTSSEGRSKVPSCSLLLFAAGAVTVHGQPESCLRCLSTLRL